MYQCKVCSETFSLLRYLRKHVTIPAGGDHQLNKCQSYYSKAGNFQDNLQVNHKIVTENTPTDELNFRTTRQRQQLMSTSNQRNSENANEDDCTIIEDELACLKFEPDEEDKIYLFDREKHILPYVDAIYNFPKKSVHNQHQTKTNNREINFIQHEEQDRTTTKQTTFQHQNSPTREVGADVSVANTTEVNSREEATICNECKLACTSLENLCIHYDTVHKLPVVSLARVTAGQVKHMKTRNSVKSAEKTKTNKCNICCKTFKTLTNLKRHKCGYHDGKIFNCNVCQKKFRSKDGLRRHTQCVHEGIWYKCNVCPKQFNRMGDLKRHKSSVHNNVRFKCDVCPKEFKWPQTLWQHKISFHEHIIYECSNCPKQFTSAQNLRLHKASVHEGVSYKCELCEKQFNCKRTLKRHKSSRHDGVRYKCNTCSKEYIDMRDLRRHKSVTHETQPLKSNSGLKGSKHRQI